jgi:LAO/AO transport system kinase
MGGPVNGWVPRVVKTIATTGDGIMALSEAINQHENHIRNSTPAHANMEKAKREVLSATRRYFEDVKLKDIESSAKFKKVVAQVEARRMNPYTAARVLFEGS